MGIQGLLPFLKSIHRESHLREWAGKTLAVDGYVWLHRGAYSCAEELCLGKTTSKHVDYFLQRINLLQRHQISAYVVFDGDHLPSKKNTEDDREDRRRTALINAHKLLAQGNYKSARDEFVKALDVTPVLAHDVILALRSAGVKYVVAPYEADAQLRYLEMKGEVDAIITEDSDLLVYGARNVLFKLDHSGHCVHICRDDFGLVEDKRMSLWTDSEFRQMAMLSGCDYLSSISGLGIKKAHDLIRRLKTAQRAIKATRLEGKLTVPPKYEQCFEVAELTFLHQFVYDCTSRSMVPLNPLPSPPPAIEYLAGCGEKWPDQVAIDVAEGRLDPLTKEFFSLKSSGAKLVSLPARVLNQPTLARDLTKPNSKKLSLKVPAKISSQQPTLKQFSFSSTQKPASVNSSNTPTRDVFKSIDNRNAKLVEKHRCPHEKSSKFFEDEPNNFADSSGSKSFELGMESHVLVKTQTIPEGITSENVESFTQDSWDAISDIPTDDSVNGKPEEGRIEWQSERSIGGDLPPRQIHDQTTLSPPIGSLSRSQCSLSSGQSHLSDCFATVSNKENQNPISENHVDSSVCASSSQEIEDQTFKKISDSDIISSESDECAVTFSKPRVTIITPNNHIAATAVWNPRRVSEPIPRHSKQFSMSSDPILSSDDKQDHDGISNATNDKSQTTRPSSRVYHSYKKSFQGFIETPLSRLSKGVKRSSPVVHPEEELSPSLARVASGIRSRFTYQKPSGKQKLIDFSQCKKEDNKKGTKRTSQQCFSNRHSSSSTDVFGDGALDPAQSDESNNRYQVDYSTDLRKTLEKQSQTVSAQIPSSETPSKTGPSKKLATFLFKGNLDYNSHGI